MRARKSNKPKPQTRYMRGPSKFKRTDLTRAAKATLAAGLPVRGIEVDPVTGRITIQVGPPAAPTDEPTDVPPHVSPHVWTVCSSNPLVPFTCVDVSSRDLMGAARLPVPEVCQQISLLGCCWRTHWTEADHTRLLDLLAKYSLSINDLPQIFSPVMSLLLRPDRTIRSMNGAGVCSVNSFEQRSLFAQQPEKRSAST